MRTGGAVGATECTDVPTDRPLAPITLRPPAERQTARQGSCDRARGGLGDVDLEVMAVIDSTKGSINGPQFTDDYVESDFWQFNAPSPSIVLIASSMYYVG